MFRSLRPNAAISTSGNNDVYAQPTLSPDSEPIAHQRNQRRSTDVRQLNDSPSVDTFDATRRRFFVGSSTGIEELLCALPMIRAQNLQTNSSGQLYFEVSTLTDPPTGATYYDEANPPVPFSTDQGGATQLMLARLGLAVPALRLDSRATAEGSASNPSYWRLQSAAYSVIRTLGTHICRGTGAETPVPGFEGLMNLPGIPFGAAELDLESSVAKALTNVHPSGNGTGEGAHCLIGAPELLRKLMLTDTAKSNSTCGFRYNPRTGLIVYHYLGIPFYRADIPVEGDETTLFAANLGPTGLHLVYGYGTPQTFGIAVDEISVGSANPITTYYVHGAWRLDVWEPEGLFKVINVPLT